MSFSALSEARWGLLLATASLVLVSACNKESIDLSGFNVACEGDDGCLDDQRCGVDGICVPKQASTGGAAGDVGGDAGESGQGGAEGGGQGEGSGEGEGEGTAEGEGEGTVEPEAGGAGGPCRADGTCDVGLVCQPGDELCVEPDCGALCAKLADECSEDFEGCERFCDAALTNLPNLDLACALDVDTSTGDCKLINTLEKCSGSDERLCRNDEDCDGAGSCEVPVCVPSSECAGLWACVEGCDEQAKQAHVRCEPPAESFQECVHDCFEARSDEERGPVAVQVGALACAHDCHFSPPPPPDQDCVAGEGSAAEPPPFCGGRTESQIQACEDIEALCQADEPYDVSCRDIVSCVLFACEGVADVGCINRCAVRGADGQPPLHWRQLEECIHNRCDDEAIIPCLTHTCAPQVDACGFPRNLLEEEGQGGQGACHEDAGCGSGQICADDACRGPHTGQEWLRCEEKCAWGQNLAEYPTCVRRCLDSVEDHGAADDHRAVVVAVACRNDCEPPNAAAGGDANNTLPTCDLTRYGDGHCGPAEGNLTPENLEQVDLVCRDVVGCMLLACGPVNPNCEARCNLEPSRVEERNPWISFTDCLANNCSGANGGGGPVGILNCVKNQCRDDARTCGYPVDDLPGGGGGLGGNQGTN